MSNVVWGITKVATQNCAYYLVVRNGVVEVLAEVCVRVRARAWPWYSVVCG